ALSTVVELTCNTRTLSRLPRAFRARATLCCLTSGDGPASLEASTKVRPRPSRHARHRERGMLAGDRPGYTRAIPGPSGQCSPGSSLASLTCVDGPLGLREGGSATGVPHLPWMRGPTWSVFPPRWRTRIAAVTGPYLWSRPPHPGGSEGEQGDAGGNFKTPVE